VELGLQNRRNKKGVEGEKGRDKGRDRETRKKGEEGRKEGGGEKVRTIFVRCKA
jgi:hypothetical protein